MTHCVDMEAVITSSVAMVMTLLVATSVATPSSVVLPNDA